MPVTNFFAHLAATPFEGCLNITVKKDAEQLTVSVLLQNEGCGDAAKNHIPPLILKGSAKELCEGFFDAVTAPLAETSRLLVNMEQYLKGQEAAKKNAAMEKKKTEKTERADKPDKPTTPEQLQEMKYGGIMAKVDALEKEGKYRDAWLKVPQLAEFPDKAEELRKRRASLSAKFSPDLFGAEQPATDVTNVEPKTENDATDDTDAEGIPDKDKGNEFALADPDPKWSIEAVMHFYANSYPTLTTAKTVGPEIKNDTVQYRFETTMGTKG